MKVFVSLPMAGKTDEWIISKLKEVREEVSTMYPGRDVLVIDSFFQGMDTSGISCPPLVYLGMSIRMMAEADLVYFVKGWKSARGCRIEHDCAVAYGLNIFCEREKICPVNGAPCNECRPGSPCAVEVESK